MIFLARPRKSSDKGPILPGPSPDSGRSTVRSRSRIGPTPPGGGVSLSQPGSRSTSPTSLKSYHTYFDSPAAPTTSVSSVSAHSLSRTNLKSNPPKASLAELGKTWTKVVDENPRKSFFVKMFCACSMLRTFYKDFPATGS